MCIRDSFKVDDHLEEYTIRGSADNLPICKKQIEWNAEQIWMREMCIRDSCNILKKNKGIRGFWRSCLDELLPMLIMTLGIYCTIVVSQFMGFPYKEHEIFAMVISIVTGVIWFILYLKMKKKVKNVLHRTIPNVLMQS